MSKRGYSVLKTKNYFLFGIIFTVHELPKYNAENLAKFELLNFTIVVITFALTLLETVTMGVQIE